MNKEWSQDLLSFDFSIIICFFPDVTLELFQCSCFSIWAHLPKDIFYSSINDSFPAKDKKNSCLTSWTKGKK